MKLTPKQMRTAAASTLAKHEKYKFYAQYFLGQTPTEVADTNCVVPNDDEFSGCWIGCEANLRWKKSPGKSGTSGTEEGVELGNSTPLLRP